MKTTNDTETQKEKCNLQETNHSGNKVNFENPKCYYGKDTIR